MIRNNTQKFKEKYGYSSVKRIDITQKQKEDSESSIHSRRFNSTQLLFQTKSTPKLQNSRRQLFRTQPTVSNPKSKVEEDKFLLFTDHTSIETIQTVMKKKRIENRQAQQPKLSKIKRVNRNSIKTRDAEEFIQNLPKNSLFFCCECFQYIFDIEKHRHFPDCKDQLNRLQGNISQVGILKLKKLVELSNYTETNAQQINELYRQFVSGNTKKITSLDYPKYSFFTLKEIVYAFTYIYDQLLRNVIYESDSTIFTCF